MHVLALARAGTAARWQLLPILVQLVILSSDNARAELTGDLNSLGYEVQLMHIDHQDSPRAGLNSDLRESSTFLSLRDRYARAAERSRARVRSLQLQLQLAQRARSKYAPQEDETEGAPSSSAGISPVFSQMGEYIMYLTLGTPPKKFTAILDTGSDLVWVQCKPCNDCFEQPDPLFDPSKSSSFRQVDCDSYFCRSLLLSTCADDLCKYSYGYGDGSYTDGSLALETITLTDSRRKRQSFPNFAFGCGSNDAGDFSSSDGLVGLGRGALSMMTQLAPKLGNRFSYCLVPFRDAVSKTSPLTIGGSQPAELMAAMSFTALIRNKAAPSFYYVQVEDLSVDGTMLKVSRAAFEIDRYGSGGTIVDSGTTLYFLTDEAYDPLKAALEPLIAYPLVDASELGFGLCYNLSAVEEPVFPSIAVHFTGATLDLPQANAFVPIDDAGTTCLVMIPTFGFSILGNLLQQNFLFLYDRENSRLGFTPKQCDQ
ncbi:aspartyl protease family protein [Marchantia polymorpha subsp. ruderalis]